MSQQATKTEIFETGIKAIDLLAPLERGGRAGLFGGAGVGKTAVIVILVSVPLLTPFSRSKPSVKTIHIRY